MIVDALLSWTLSLLQGIFSFLPAWNVTLPTEQVKYLVGEATRWNSVAPVSEVFTIGSILILFLGALLAFKFLKWVIDSILAVIP